MKLGAQSIGVAVALNDRREDNTSLYSTLCTLDVSY